MDLSGYALTILHQDAEFVLWRGVATASPSPHPASVLVSMPTSERPGPDRIRMLEHELAMRAELDSSWAVRPLALGQHQGRAALILEDQPGEPLERLLGQPPVSRAPGAPRSAEPAMELGLFLRLAAGLATALGEAHRRGLIHKDVKPAHVLVNTATGQAWLTGFGIASRLPRERQTPDPPETIAGTLAYMAPEQTGRMNRSIDGRSDLYSLGVTLYQMLTGSLPFTADEPMELVHCHIARQPMAPGERVANVPAPVSAIIMKLLAKAAEQRYQTAAGLERDLRRCLAQWEAERRISDFRLGEHDTPDRLVIPEKLYGREREVDTLLAAFDRVVEGGGPELVLVSGYSGIGKSSVVNELHKALVQPRALLTAGKFDQYKRDIPYSTIAQALQRLIHTLLTKRDDELDRWREALLEAVGPHGQLMVDLVPDLEVIVGEQPAVPELPPLDAQRRFQYVFRRLLGVFARPEHPLALFLDDLQWLDAATLDVLQDLMIQSDVRYLLLIGAYRDNEITAAHPLMRRLETIRGTAGAHLHEIALAPLGADDVRRLIEESLYCDAGRAEPLAQLVLQKTAGNPFFAIQFLWALVGEGLVTFDHAEARWRWDLTRVHERGSTDNVVDLIVGALNRLPRGVQRVLRQLACLGHSADGAVLVMTCEDAKEALDRDLQLALQTGLILRSDGAYRFLHDRVQEAAYSLIPEAARAEAHLRIGRLLLAHASPEERGNTIFDIVHQLNRGAALISSREEREQLAELNLIAGLRAKAAAAYTSALSYLTCGAELLGDDGWQGRHALLFELELQRAECELLSGEPTSAEQRLTMLSSRAGTIVERCAVTCLVADLRYALQQMERGLTECLECLRHAGLEIPIHPTRAQAQAAYDRTCSKLEAVGNDELVELPLLSDATSRAVLDVLAKITTTATVTDANLGSLLLCAAVDISLQRGHSDGSCVAYEFLGYVAGWHFGDCEAAVRLGRLALDLIARKGLRRFESYISNNFLACIMPWATPVARAREPFRATFEVATKSGDHGSACANRCELILNLLWSGAPLVEVEREAECGLEFCRRTAFSLLIDSATLLAAFVRNLRGLTRQFGLLDDERFDELRRQQQFASQPQMVVGEFWYWVTTLQVRFLAADYAGALGASIRAETLLSDSLRRNQLWATNTFRVELEFYGALAHAAACDSAPPHEERRHHVDTVAGHLLQLELWARQCPANFENRAALVAAELARIEGRDGDATKLYEHAIRSARENGFVHHEAVSLELAAQFYAGRGFERIAKAYLQDARSGYLEWGADGKVRQLEARYPYLADQQIRAAAKSTLVTAVEHLDLSTVLRVSQAVQVETDLEKLIVAIMRLSLEHAGAVRGLLILPHGDTFRIEAEAKSTSDAVTVELRQARVGIDDLPSSILQYVLRTRKRVLLQDAAAASEFDNDEYLRRRRARSVLCIPLLKQARLTGVIYLENNLMVGTFTPARMALLEVLASDAAISLDNARLYRDLDEREHEAQLIVNTIPGLVASLTRAGEIDNVNDQLVQYCGQGLEAMRQWGTNGTVHLEDLPRVAEIFTRAITSGEPYEFEARIRRFDGVYRWFQVRGLPLRDGSGHVVRWYSLLSDVDDRKRAEVELQEAYDGFVDVQRLSKTGSFITDLVADDHNWSEEIYRIFEFDPGSKVTLQRFRETVHPDDLADFEAANARAMTGEDVKVAFRIVTPRGAIKHLRGFSHVRGQSPAEHPLFVGALQDVTESVVAEEALNRVRSDLAHVARLTTMGELTASIAHEVKQPIAAAVTSAQTALRWLEARPPELGEVREALSRIVHAGKRAGDIIGRIRALVTKAPPRKDSVEINAAIREVVELTRGESVKSRVSVRTDLAEELPLIQGDRVQLQQVILNLIVNALESMAGVSGTSRNLLICSRREDAGGVRVSVADTGPGLAAGAPEQMFTPFYTTKPGGLGLGLSICRSIIEAHDGRLGASANEPCGAVFEFILPGPAK